MESEKDTEKYLGQEMEVLGGKSWKWVCPNIRGVPDRICLFPSGWVVFVELKSEGKKPEAHQRRIHNLMRKMNLVVQVIDTEAGVDHLINHYKEKHSDS